MTLRRFEVFGSEDQWLTTENNQRELSQICLKLDQFCFIVKQILKIATNLKKTNVSRNINGV